MLQQGRCGAAAGPAAAPAPAAAPPAAPRLRLGPAAGISCASPAASPAHRVQQVVARVAYTDRSYTDRMGGMELVDGSNYAAQQATKQQHPLAASMLSALKAEVKRTGRRFTIAVPWRQGSAAEKELLARLQSELEAARQEAVALQGEARSAAALRDELAAKSAALEESREQLLRMEQLRAEELQASLARYSELSRALAELEDPHADSYSGDTQALTARVATLEAELADASRLASVLAFQLEQSHSARQDAQRAQREASVAAELAQQEVQALAERLADQKGELAYHSHELFSEEEGRLVAELEAQQRECASLQLAVFKMREQVDNLKAAASRGGREAGLHRAQAQKLQAELTQLLFQSDRASQRLLQLEGALEHHSQHAAQVAQMQRTHWEQRGDCGTARQANNVVSLDGFSKREAMMASAQQRLQQLEDAVRRAMDDCDSATTALSEALQGQHAAEQAHRGVQQQLAAQMARVASLEEALAQQMASADDAAMAAAERELSLEQQLSAQVTLAQAAEQRTLELEAQLAQQALQLSDLSALEAQMVEQLEHAVQAQWVAGMNAHVMELAAGKDSLRVELEAGRQRLGELEAALAAQTQHADAQAALALDLDEKLRAAKAKAEAVRLELTAQMEEERARSSRLEGELSALRKEHERAEKDLHTLSFQLHRAEAQAERSVQELSIAKSQVSYLQMQLDAANAELEQLRAQGAVREAQLEEASRNAKALSAEVAALTATLKDKDAAVAYWQSEAEQRSRLAEAAGAEAAASREALHESQVAVTALREQLRVAQARVLQADQDNAELRLKTEQDLAEFRAVLESAEAAAMKMGQQLLEVTREKEAMAATALARADGRVVVRRSNGKDKDGYKDYISEEEVEGLLDELDAVREELAVAVEYADELAAKADAAEAEVTMLQAQLDNAKSDAYEAEFLVAKLKTQLEQLKAAEEQGSGKKVADLMQELSAAKAAARTAQAHAEKLAEEKAALLREMAIGHQGPAQHGAGAGTHASGSGLRMLSGGVRPSNRRTALVRALPPRSEGPNHQKHT